MTLACLTAGLQALFGGRNLRPLLIGSSLMLFQQITGESETPALRCASPCSAVWLALLQRRNTVLSSAQPCCRAAQRAVLRQQHPAGRGLCGRQGC